MSKYDELPREERELADHITMYANLERNAFEKDHKNWLMSKEELWDELLKLHEKVKKELCKILIRN